jgi:hypothetical protein
MRCSLRDDRTPVRATDDTMTRRAMAALGRALVLALAVVLAVAPAQTRAGGVQPVGEVKDWDLDTSSATTTTTTDGEGGGEEARMSMQELFNWAIEHSDPERLREMAENVKNGEDVVGGGDRDRDRDRGSLPDPFSASSSSARVVDRRWTEDELSQKRADVREALDALAAHPTEQTYIKLAHAVYADATAPVERRLEALETLTELIRPVDNANDLHVLGAFYLTLVPIRPRRRGERRSLRTFSPGVSLRPGPIAHNPDTPRRLSTPLLTPMNSTPTFARMDPRPSGALNPLVRAATRVGDDEDDDAVGAAAAEALGVALSNNPRVRAMTHAWRAPEDAVVIDRRGVRKHRVDRHATDPNKIYSSANHARHEHPPHGAEHREQSEHRIALAKSANAAHGGKHGDVDHLSGAFYVSRAGPRTTASAR